MMWLGTITCKNLLYPMAYKDIVELQAEENDIEYSLVLAVIKTESNFVVDAHSGKASGLMQLTDETAEWIADKMDINADEINLMEPADNIRLGCFYLKYLIDYYNGNEDVALAAYNGGMGNVNKWLDDEKYSSDGETLDYIPFKETREYVKKVRKEQKVYEEILLKENKI